MLDQVIDASCMWISERWLTRHPPCVYIHACDSAHSVLAAWSRQRRLSGWRQRVSWAPKRARRRQAPAKRGLAAFCATLAFDLDDEDSHVASSYQHNLASTDVQCVRDTVSLSKHSKNDWGLTILANVLKPCAKLGYAQCRPY